MSKITVTLTPGTYPGGSPEAQSVKRAGDPAVAYIVVAADGTVTRFYGTRIDALTVGDPRCPACGELIDYCQGHGEIGDPGGWAVLDAHDNGGHEHCHHAGCDDAPRD